MSRDKRTSHRNDLDRQRKSAKHANKLGIIDDAPEAPGEPTVPAADEVSLASVFDGSAPEPGSPTQSPDSPDEVIEGGVSYDEFYGTDGTAGDDASSDENVSSDENASSDDEASSDENDFKDWLEGLKT